MSTTAIFACAAALTVITLARAALRRVRFKIEFFILNQ